MYKYSYLLVLVAFLSTACFNNANKDNQQQDSLVTASAEDSLSFASDTSLRGASERVLSLMKAEKFDSLTLYFHPEKGVRFSPYGFIDTAGHIRMDATDFQQALNAEEVLHWGAYDGSGDPIDATIREYFDRFVYDADFLNAEQTHEDRTVASGNSLNNLSQIYPQARYTESYFSGFEEKYQGMDWRALRLVFEKKDGRYLLIAVVHDEWTI